MIDIEYEGVEVTRSRRSRQRGKSMALEHSMPMYAGILYHGVERGKTRFTVGTAL